MPRSSKWFVLRKNLDDHEVKKQKLASLAKEPVPGCYIFGIKRPEERTVRTVYVGIAGKGQGLFRRIQRHANWDKSTRYFMKNVLRSKQYWVYFKYYRTRTTGEAIDMEETFLRQWWKFPWNAAGNPSRPKKV
jgi:hypothetical protein